jgi:putative isomerase
MNTVAILSTRLYGQDGVSVEARKWEQAYRSLGCEIALIAGELGATDTPHVLVPELSFSHPQVVSLGERAFGPPLPASERSALRNEIEVLADTIEKQLRAALARFGVDVLSVENALAIPMNLPLGLALQHLIAAGQRTIARHHDFYWERERFHHNNVEWLLHRAFPPSQGPICHVTISDQARRELHRKRGLDATWVPNAFDFSDVRLVDDYNRGLRDDLGIGPEQKILLQPTRFIPRKGIHRAVELVARLRADYGLDGVLVVTGPAGDEGYEYQQEVLRKAEAAGVRVICAAEEVGFVRGAPGARKRYTMGDAYVYADLVTFPSDLEGFGNPVIEAAMYGRPLFVNRYPVLDDILMLAEGRFDFIVIDGDVTTAAVARACEALTDPVAREKMVYGNFVAARQHFSMERLAQRLQGLLDSLQAQPGRFAAEAEPALPPEGATLPPGTVPLPSWRRRPVQVVSEGEKPSPYLDLLQDRIDLESSPFSERGSRLLVLRRGYSLGVRLAERWTKLEARLGDFHRRQPIINDLYLIDGFGSLLDFTLTTYPHKLSLQTNAGLFEIAFLDTETLFISLPESEAGVRFKVQAEQGRTDRRGGTFKGPRNVAYTTNARIISNIIGQVESSYFQVELTARGEAGTGLVLNITPRLGFNRTVRPAADVLAEAARRWHDWFAAVPKVDEPYQAQYYYAWWVMRSGLVSSRYYMTREGMMPSKAHYVGVWQWDAFFHALAYRYVDTKLAEDQLRIVLDHQREDGMVPGAIHDEGIVTYPEAPVDADVTKPPVIAWTALKLYEKSGHLDFLNEIYEPLVHWNEWWFRHDDDRDSIVQYDHPFSSGMDDSPMWGEGMPVESPDLNVCLCLQMEALAEIARLIGETEDAKMWAQRSRRLAARIVEHFYDPAAGLFWPTRHHRPIRVLTPFCLYPLWLGRLLDKKIADQLVAHLTDPGEFWTAYPIPTVAVNDPHYNPDQIWRGPTYLNVNYIFIDALVKSGYPDLARQLCDRTLELVMKHDDIYEYYHPETGDHSPRAAPTYGWSSALFIDLVIKASRGEII